MEGRKKKNKKDKNKIEPEEEAIVPKDEEIAVETKRKSKKSTIKFQTLNRKNY